MGDSGPGRSKRGTPPSQTAEKANSTDPLEAWTEEILQEINRQLREESDFFSPEPTPEDATEAKSAGDLPPAAEPQASADPQADESISTDAPTAGTGDGDPLMDQGLRWPVAPRSEENGSDSGSARPEDRSGDTVASDPPTAVAEQGTANRDGLMTGDLADNVRDAFSLAAQALGAPAVERSVPEPVHSAPGGEQGSDADGPAEDPGHRVTIDESPELPGSADADCTNPAPDDQIFAALAGKTQAPNPNRPENGPPLRVDGTVREEIPPKNPETGPPVSEGSAPADSGAARSPSTPRAAKSAGPTTPAESHLPAEGEARAALAVADEHGRNPERAPVATRQRRFLPALDVEDAQSHAKEGRRIAAKVGLQAYGLSMTRPGASKGSWLGRAAVIAVPVLVFLAGGFIGWSAYWTEGTDVPEVDRAGEIPAASVADAPQKPRIREDGVAQTKPATFPEPQPAPAASGPASEPDENARVADTTVAVGPAAEDAEEDLAKDSPVQAPVPAQTDSAVVASTGSAAVAEAEPAENSTDAAAIGDREAQDGAALPSRPVETAAVPSLRAVDVAGTAGNPIPLSVASLPTTVKGGQSFMIAGVPTGVSLSAGSNKGDGVWILRSEDLDGLTLTPPAGYNGAFVLTVAMMKDRSSAKTPTSEILEVTVEGPSPDIARLITRGDTLLKLGDIASARLMFERAAVHGSAVAATSVGKTHDPVFHMELGVRGPQADSEAAADWYQKGLAGGDREAEIRLAKLKKWLTLRQRSPAK